MAQTPIFAEPTIKDSSNSGFLTQASKPFEMAKAKDPTSTTSDIETAYNSTIADLNSLSEVRTAYDSLNAPFSAQDEGQVNAAGNTAGLEYDSRIAQAREEKRQGMARATIGAGERGGFMNTQFAGIGALMPTEGDTFVGTGGELSRIQDQYSLTIAELENAKQVAIQKAKSAEREYIKTGRRQAYDDLLKYTSEARATADQQIQQANAKTTALLNAKKLQDELNKPVIEATEAVQKYAVKSMEDYASGFVDLEPADIPNLTLKQIQERILRSDEYKLEAQGEQDKAAGSDYQEYKNLQKLGEIPANMTYLGYQKLLATQYGTEKAGGSKNGFSFSSGDQTKLLGSGFSLQDMKNIEADVETAGLDAVLADPSLTEQQRGVLNDIFKVQTSKLTRSSLSDFFGIPDTAERSGIKGFFGAGKTNAEKLTELVDAVEKYKAVGYTDVEILKIMEDQS